MGRERRDETFNWHLGGYGGVGVGRGGGVEGRERYLVGTFWGDCHLGAVMLDVHFNDTSYDHFLLICVCVCGGGGGGCVCTRCRGRWGGGGGEQTESEYIATTTAQKDS